MPSHSGQCSLAKNTFQQDHHLHDLGKAGFGTTRQVVWLGQGKADSPSIGRAGRSGDAELGEPRCFSWGRAGFVVLPRSPSDSQDAQSDLGNLHVFERF